MKNPILLVLLLTSSLIASSHAQLTRIIRTGDPIPGSPGLTAGTVFRHPEMDGGHAAFFTDHEQFGVTVPSNTLLYWDGSTLTKVADDDTPVPGLPGQKILLNDITDPDTITITPQIATQLTGPWQSGPGVLEEISATPDPENPDLTIVRVRSLRPNSPTSAYFRISVTSTE